MLFQSISVGGNFPKIYWYNCYLKQFAGKLNYIFFAQIIYCTIYLGNTIPYVMRPSWSYGSWIYNYMCNQCLSSLKLWVQTLLKVCQWSATGRWFSPGTRLSPPIKLTATMKVVLNTLNKNLYVTLYIIG